MKREVVDVCPHCDEEVVMMWDVDEKGYQPFCPHCGKKMMLCDECMNAEDNEVGACDWSEEGGCFRKRESK